MCLPPFPSGSAGFRRARERAAAFRPWSGPRPSTSRTHREFLGPRRRPTGTPKAEHGIGRLRFQDVSNPKIRLRAIGPVTLPRFPSLSISSLYRAIGVPLLNERHRVPVPEDRALKSAGRRQHSFVQKETLRPFGYHARGAVVRIFGYWFRQATGQEQPTVVGHDPHFPPTSGQQRLDAVHQTGD